jgi:hypothetical protein
VQASRELLDVRGGGQCIRLAEVLLRDLLEVLGYARNRLGDLSFQFLLPTLVVRTGVDDDGAIGDAIQLDRRFKGLVFGRRPRLACRGFIQPEFPRNYTQKILKSA